MEESILELKGEKVKNKEVDIKININAIVPETYVQSDRERMRLYKRIAGLSSRAEIRELTSELRDVYGEIPKDVLNLFDISYISSLASELNVAEVVSNQKGTGLRFRGSSAFKEKNILFAIAQMGDRCVVANTPPSVVFRAQKLTAEEKIGEIITFLELATKNL